MGTIQAAPGQALGQNTVTIFCEGEVLKALHAVASHVGSIGHIGYIGLVGTGHAAPFPACFLNNTITVISKVEAFKALNTAAAVRVIGHVGHIWANRATPQRACFYKRTVAILCQVEAVEAYQTGAHVGSIGIVGPVGSVGHIGTLQAELNSTVSDTVPLWTHHISWLTDVAIGGQIGGIGCFTLIDGAKIDASLAIFDVARNTNSTVVHVISMYAAHASFISAISAISAISCIGIVVLVTIQAVWVQAFFRRRLTSSI